MHKAKLISTQGPYLEALLEIEGRIFCVFDEFSVDEKSSPLQESEFEYQFSCETDGDESWEEIFSSNLERKIGVEHIEGWKYRAYGKVIAIDPVQVDCGLLIADDVISTHDTRVIGEFVGFTITRLGGYAY